MKIVLEKSKPFVCTLCETSFRRKDQLKVHNDGIMPKRSLKNKTENLQRKFHCLICDTRFVCRQGLKRHIGSAHEEKKSLNHEKLKPFACELCEATLVYKSRLKQHIKEVHEKSTLYSCKECKSAFSRASM